MKPILDARSFDVTGGKLHARIAGNGTTLLFVHAIMVNSHVWDPLIPELTSDYRLVMLDMPLGAHRVPLASNADCSLPAHAARVVQVAKELDGPIVLIGNNTGGAIAQLAVIQAPEVFERLVLLPCDAFDNCPPKLIGYIRHLPKFPGAVRAIVEALRAPPMARLLMKSVASVSLEQDVLDRLLGDLRSNSDVRRDLEKLLVNLHPEVTMAAAHALPQYDRPVGLLWTYDDLLFPVEHAHRLKSLFPNATLELIEGCRTLMALDRPEAVSSFLRKFVGQP